MRAFYNCMINFKSFLVIVLTLCHFSMFIHLIVENINYLTGIGYITKIENLISHLNSAVDFMLGLEKFVKHCMHLSR